MSQPQSTEVWDTHKPKGGFGVEMTPEQFEVLSSKMNFVTEETARREIAVSESLQELKQIEAVRSYASFVKDITTSIQTLSTLPNTEIAIGELLQSLHKVTETFNPSGELNFESKTLSLQTDKKTIATHKTISLQDEYYSAQFIEEENG
jgi:predicted RND superfamily exporter protein